MQHKLLNKKILSNLYKKAKSLEPKILQKDLNALLEYNDLYTLIDTYTTNTKEEICKISGVSGNNFGQIVYKIYAADSDPTAIALCEYVGDANVIMDRMDRFLRILPDNIIDLSIINVSKGKEE